MKRQQRNKHRGGENGSSSISSSLSTSANLKCKDTRDSGFPEQLLRQCHIGYHNINNAPPSPPIVETLVPNAVFIARNAMSSKECQDWIKYAEDSNSWDKVSHPATRLVAHRECGRIQKNDWNMSHRLYQRIESVIEHVSPQLNIFDKASFQSKYKSTDGVSKYQPITCNPNLRLYKYTKGQWFGRHVDESNVIDFSSSTKYNNTTKIKESFFPNASSITETQTEITVLFYLSSCRGGATTFHLPNQKKKGARSNTITSIAFTPEEGAVLLHIHGDRCLEHEAEPVLEGVKYVLRTDIVYGIVQ